MIVEWNIQSRSHVCHACSTGFRDGQSYHTVLMEKPPAFERNDLCEACWGKQLAGLGVKPEYLSHWQGEYLAPPAAPPDPIKKETAETLLRKLLEQHDSRHDAACYILAVMLERKRLLKVKSQLRENGVRSFVYEQPRTGDVFVIKDPDLQLAQLETIQREIATLLENRDAEEAGNATQKTPSPMGDDLSSAPLTA